MPPILAYRLLPSPRYKQILGTDYTYYESSLEKCSLDTLFNRRENRCLTFGLRSIKHPKHSSMFPLNDTQVNLHDIRSINKLKVNFARTSTYQKSSIPYSLPKFAYVYLSSPIVTAQLNLNSTQLN